MDRIKKKSKLIPAIELGNQFEIIVDGKPIPAYLGETVATVLMAANITTFRKSRKNQDPRGVYCGMGVCYECLVTINGVHAQRACITYAQPGMQVETCQEVQL